MSPINPRRRTQAELKEFERLQSDCSRCTRCVQDGLIPFASPTFQGRLEAPFFLVGQAPGPIETETRTPFSGRAGRELARWMLRAGFASEEEFRRQTYIAALMRCFPGRKPSGGDVRPPLRAVLNCAPWLEAELALVRPQVIIPVGQLAIERFLGAGSLQERVGRSFGRDPAIIPLPHPSGQSRWLNLGANRALLSAALGLLSAQRDGLR